MPLSNAILTKFFSVKEEYIVDASSHSNTVIFYNTLFINRIRKNQLCVSRSSIYHNVILRLVEDGSVASKDIRVVRFEHTVRSNLVNHVEEVLNLRKRELDAVVHLTRTHEFCLWHLCVNEN